MTADLTADLAEVLSEHEHLVSDDYRTCRCGEETTNYGGLLAHLAAVLAARVAVREDKHAALVARVQALADEWEEVERAVQTGTHDGKIAASERGAMSGRTAPHPGEFVFQPERSRILRALLTDADTDALAVRDAEVRAGALEAAADEAQRINPPFGICDHQWLRDRARAERGSS